MSDSKFILMTETTNSAGSKVVDIQSAAKFEGLKESLKGFLLATLNLESIGYEFFGSDSSDLVRGTIIHRNNEPTATVINMVNVTNYCDESKSYLEAFKNKVALTIDDFNFKEMCNLIHALIAAGDLSYNKELLASKGLTYSNMPKILLAEITVDPKESNLSVIKSIASNDALLLYIDSESDSTENANIRNGHSLFANESMLKNIERLDERKDAAISESWSEAFKSYNKPSALLPYLTTQKNTWDDRTLTEHVANKEYVNESLILSNVFVEAFEEMTARRLNFVVQNSIDICQSSTNMVVYNIKRGKLIDEKSCNIFSDVLIDVSSDNLQEMVLELSSDNSEYKNQFNRALHLFFFQEGRSQEVEWTQNKSITNYLEEVSIYDDNYQILAHDYSGRINAGKPVVGTQIESNQQKDEHYLVTALLCEKEGANKNDIIYTLLVSRVGCNKEPKVDQVIIGKNPEILVDMMYKQLKGINTAHTDLVMRISFMNLLTLAGFGNLDTISSDDLLSRLN